MAADFWTSVYSGACYSYEWDTLPRLHVCRNSGSECAIHGNFHWWYVDYLGARLRNCPQTHGESDSSCSTHSRQIYCLWNPKLISGHHCLWAIATIRCEVEFSSLIPVGCDLDCPSGSTLFLNFFNDHCLSGEDTRSLYRNWAVINHAIVFCE